MKTDELLQAVKHARRPPKGKSAVSTLKHEYFVDAYIRNGLSETKVAQELGVTQKAISTRMRNKAVRDLLKQELNKRINANASGPVFTKEFALEHLTGIVNTSPMDFLNDDGTGKTTAEIKQMPRGMQLALKEVSTRRVESYNSDGTVKAAVTFTNVTLIERKGHWELVSRIAKIIDSDEAFTVGLMQLMQQATERQTRMLNVIDVTPQKQQKLLVGPTA